MPRCKKPRVSVSATEIPPTLAAVLEEQAGSLVLLRGQTRRMLGDGDCLYHSLSCGLNKILKRSEWTAHDMRLHLAHWVAEHPDEEVAGSQLKQWIQWDSHCSINVYVEKMMKGVATLSSSVVGWGGAIECVAYSRSFNVNVLIYQPTRSGGHRCMAVFFSPAAGGTLPTLPLTLPLTLALTL